MLRNADGVKEFIIHEEDDYMVDKNVYPDGRTEYGIHLYPGHSLNSLAKATKHIPTRRRAILVDVLNGEGYHGMIYRLVS
ncbi:hypothetical protein [Streptosporangium sp. OZ121]|uniref:hypothetical protein n=1 Tax=Streptosporangium sp. OZ121 TaxID=3444183 RepID=UPI003F79E223